MVTAPRQADPDRPDVSSFTLLLFPDTIIHIYVFSGGASGYSPEVTSSCGTCLLKAPLLTRSVFSCHDLF